MRAASILRGSSGVGGGIATRVGRLYLDEHRSAFDGLAIELEGNGSIHKELASSLDLA